MKHIIVIFAHPDDEAFGPSGTLIKEIRANGSAVHLICVTTGNDGSNPDNHDDLATVREGEWRQAGELIGASSLHWLGYDDGHLDNSLYHTLASTITEIIRTATQDAADDDTIELMSGDFNGISGHIDHIVTSRVSAYVFYTMKATDARFTQLRLTCIPVEWVPVDNTDWLYMEAGRSSEEIDEIVDAREYADEVFAVMRTHRSQRSDCEGHITNRGTDVALNHFIVKQ